MTIYGPLGEEDSQAAVLYVRNNKTGEITHRGIVGRDEHTLGEYAYYSNGTLEVAVQL